MIHAHRAVPAGSEHVFLKIRFCSGGGSCNCKNNCKNNCNYKSKTSCHHRDRDNDNYKCYCYCGI